MEYVLEHYRRKLGIPTEEQNQHLASAKKKSVGSQLVQERLKRLRVEQSLNILGQELVKLKLGGA
jgi:hypothetical protein